jgi:hypothetical protein
LSKLDNFFLIWHFLNQSNNQMKKSLLIIIAIIALNFTLLAQSWVIQTTGLPINHYVNYLSIPDTNIVWGTTIDAAAATTPTREWVKTIDGGATWTTGIISAAPSTYAVSNIKAINKDTAWVAMYDGTNGSGGIFRTNDGGANWTKQTTATFTAPNGFPNWVYMWNDTVGVSMGDPNGGYFEIYTTTNGGTNWVRTAQANIPNPTSGEYGYTNEIAVVGDTVWFATNKGRVYRSIDMGLNWTVATTGFTDLGEIHFSDANNGMVEQVGGTNIRTTTDGGLTWSNVSYTGILYNFDIAAVPGVSGMYWSVGEDALQNPGSSYSTDNGVTWSDALTYDQLTSVSFYDVNHGWGGGVSDGSTGGMFKFVPPTPVGVSHLTVVSNGVSVSPNPSKGVFELKFNNFQNEVAVYNVIGKKVYESTFNGVLNKTVDISSYPAGVYFVKVISDGKVYSEKIILQ